MRLATGNTFDNKQLPTPLSTQVQIDTLIFTVGGLPM